MRPAVIKLDCPVTVRERFLEPTYLKERATTKGMRWTKNQPKFNRTVTGREGFVEATKRSQGFATNCMPSA
jgi:hypothetical protein